MRRVIVLTVMGVALLATACGGGGTPKAQGSTPSEPSTPSTPSSPAVTPGCAPSGTELHVTAKGVKFDASCLAAPADTKFTIEFENKDGGVQHNIVIEDGDQFLNGEPVTGVDDVTYRVDPIPAGIYTFFCKFHPGEMQGQFVVQ